jgi:hypothetical protein
LNKRKIDMNQEIRKIVITGAIALGFAGAMGGAAHALVSLPPSPGPGYVYYNGSHPGSNLPAAWYHGTSQAPGSTWAGCTAANNCSGSGDRPMANIKGSQGGFEFSSDDEDAPWNN